MPAPNIVSLISGQAPQTKSPITEAQLEEERAWAKRLMAKQMMERQITGGVPELGLRLGEVAIDAYAQKRQRDRDTDAKKGYVDALVKGLAGGGTAASPPTGPGSQPMSAPAIGGSMPAALPFQPQMGSIGPAPSGIVEDDPTQKKAAIAQAMAGGETPPGSPQDRAELGAMLNPLPQPQQGMPPAGMPGGQPALANFDTNGRFMGAPSQQFDERQAGPPMSARMAQEAGPTPGGIPPQQAAAITPDQMPRQPLPVAPEQMASPGGIEPVEGARLSGKAASPVARAAYAHFISKGMAPHQAAAIAGNMAWESGGNPALVNPNDNMKNSPRSPHSAGIGQWNDRLPAALAFWKSRGVAIPEGDLRDPRYVRQMIAAVPVEEQLAFAEHEMGSTEARAKQGITAAPDLTSASAAAIGYHRPAGWTRNNPTAGHAFANRTAIGQEIMNGYRPTGLMAMGMQGGAIEGARPVRTQAVGRGAAPQPPAQTPQQPQTPRTIGGFDEATFRALALNPYGADMADKAVQSEMARRAGPDAMKTAQIEKLRAETAQLNQKAPNVKEVNGELVRINPDGSATKVYGGDNPKLTEQQTKDAQFAERLERSNRTIDDLLTKHGYDPTRSINAFIPDNWNLVNSGSWQKYQQAAREGLASILRKDTGAAVTKEEFNLYFPMYFPQPGDSKAVVAQKKEARDQFATGIKRGSGPAYNHMFPEGSKPKDGGGAVPQGWSVKRVP